MANICGVRFKQAGKVFYFDAADIEVHVGAYVVAETAQGLALGRVVIAPDQVLVSESRDALKPIIRLASQDDLEKDEQLKEKAKEAADLLRQKVAEQGLPMSIAGAEYDLAGSQLTAFFTAPDRVDFRNVVRDAARELGARVQLLQVGERDRAKLVDGIDICGERLCCASWMTNFPSVSIRMAKEQDLPLNPQKISGVCGRLYCCLTFEYDEYKALRGTLPKVGAFLSTPAGEAKVTGIDFNREMVRLFLTESRTQIEIAAVDFQLQHGVTVRPMEIVRRVEGPLRTITEDTGGRGRRPARGQPPAVPPAAVSRPARPLGPEAQAPAAAGEQPEGVARRRRRRRRRGRGGGPNPESAGPPA